MSSSPGTARLIAFAIGFMAVIVRLPLIDQPFVDQWSWRQSDVAAIARNYFHEGYRFAYPQIDWAGNEPGYVGTEFPILPYTAAIVYRMTGIHAWVGRIQALLFFALSLPFFFWLVRDLCGEETALWSMFFYAFAPLGIMASRCFMPDMPSMSLSIAGLYFFRRWLKEARPAFFWLAAIVLAIGILIKLPTILIGVPLAYLAFERFGTKSFRRPELWIFGGIVLLPSCAWYWHAKRVADAFYPHHFFGAGGVAIQSPSWYVHVMWVTIWSGLTILLSLIAVAGLLLDLRARRSVLFVWWGAATLLFIFAVGYGNRHPWYQLPLVPIAAVFGASFCVWLSRALPRSILARGALGLLAAAFLLLSAGSTKARYAGSASDLKALGDELKALTPPGAIVVVADLGDPTALYYAERKGWHFMEKDGLYDGHPSDSHAAVSNLDELRKRGASWLAFYSGTDWWPDYYQEFGEYLNRTATLERTNARFRIYRLPPNASGQ